MAINPLWNFPDGNICLADDEVHIWNAKMTACYPFLDALFDVLSEDEKKRAGRMYFEKDRRNFIVAHGALRNILSRYLGINPDKIRYSHDKYGKPRIHPPSHSGGLNFNLTHSHGLALFALTRYREIGVDVEYIRPCTDYEAISERFFSKMEFRMLQGLPCEEKNIAFFHCWVRKEAFLKAIGTGLSAALDKFAVSVYPDGPPVLLETEIDQTEKDDWSLYRIDLGSEYAAAFAVEGKTPLTVKHWSWGRENLLSKERSDSAFKSADEDLKT